MALKSSSPKASLNLDMRAVKSTPNSHLCLLAFLGRRVTRKARLAIAVSTARLVNATLGAGPASTINISLSAVLLLVCACSRLQDTQQTLLGSLILGMWVGLNRLWLAISNSFWDSK
jgi:hypothetical protein